MLLCCVYLYIRPETFGTTLVLSPRLRFLSKVTTVSCSFINSASAHLVLFTCNVKVMKLMRCERDSHNWAVRLRGHQDGVPVWRQRHGRHLRRQSRWYGDRQRNWRGVGDGVDADTIRHVWWAVQRPSEAVPALQQLEVQPGILWDQGSLRIPNSHWRSLCRRLGEQ